ncbi:aminopeptidase N-like [Polyergus mexicanus]|uniref:aminopeptidase N-like n=1 Tax=Polyergus mexicanus TaxID=615972 RepID=UPI0038B533A3
MRFIGTLTDNRGIRTFYKGRENTVWLPAVHFETFYARQIFPCWDNPKFKTTFNISIMHHKNYEVLSNMPWQKEEAVENDMLWTYFDITPSMPTYLVAAVIANKLKFPRLYIGMYSGLYIDDVTIQYRSQSSSDLWYAQKIIQDIMHFLRREWKDVKMIWKVDNIVFPYYEDNGMINLGLVFYRESDIIYDEDKDPSGRKVEVARLIAYKTAQEWFHNVFTTSWCSTVIPPWLHKAFVTFMGSYIVDKALPETRMMNLFVVQIQHEALHLDIDFQSSTSQAALSEIISYFKDEDVTIYLGNITGNLSIPLTYTTQIQLDFDNTSPDIWLFYKDSYTGGSSKRNIQKIKNLASNEWIIFNLQQTGYYRVNYDTNNWELISNYLQTENYRNIHVLNRAQIIDDAFHLMLTYQLEPSIFWNIIIYLQKETDYVVWYPMFKALEYISSIFSIDDVDAKLFIIKIITRNTLHKMLKKIGYTEISNEDEHTKCLRQEAAKWACLLRHEECLKEANEKLMQHFADPKNNTCTQNIDMIKYLRNIATVINESDPEDYILRSQAINNFFTIITKHIRIITFRKYIINNFEKILPRQISTVATLTVIINYLYNDKELIELDDFVKNNLRKERLHSEFNVGISSQTNKIDIDVICFRNTKQMRFCQKFWIR